MSDPLADLRSAEITCGNARRAVNVLRESIVDIRRHFANVNLKLELASEALQKVERIAKDESRADAAEVYQRIGAIRSEIEQISDDLCVVMNVVSSVQKLADSDEDGDNHEQ